MKISYVIPCYNSAGTLAGVVNEITTKMELMTDYEYEIILVNDASTDETYNIIHILCEKNQKIYGISLSNNFGQHAALMAGFHRVSGDIIVCLDDDGQTPADEADKLLTRILEGYDVVYAEYEKKQHSLFRNLGSKINMKMAECMLGKPKDLYISSYFAVRRFVIEEIKKYQNPYPYVIGLVLRTTKNICNVKVLHRERTVGKSGYSIKKLIILWTNGFTSFSIKPLRLATICGAVTSIAGLLYTGWTIIKKFINPLVPLGWSSIIAIILVTSGGILFELGMIGEYIGRIYICINNSPQYVIKDETNSRNNNKYESGSAMKRSKN